MLKIAIAGAATAASIVGFTPAQASVQYEASGTWHATSYYDTAKSSHPEWWRGMPLPVVNSVVQAEEYSCTQALDVITGARAGFPEAAKHPNYWGSVKYFIAGYAAKGCHFWIREGDWRNRSYGAYGSRWSYDYFVNNPYAPLPQSYGPILYRRYYTDDIYMSEGTAKRLLGVAVPNDPYVKESYGGSLPFRYTYNSLGQPIRWGNQYYSGTATK